MQLDGIEFNWPDDDKFPKDYQDLQVKYGSFVAQRVNRLNKVHRNVGDILQEMWTRLCSSKFLEKFVTSAAKKYPIYMTCQEACDYLGVNSNTWFQHQYQFEKKPETSLWMPEPVEGGKYSRKAVYYTDDIFLLEEIRQYRPRVLKPVRPRRRPKLSVYGFRAYLARSIHNHFANWCRGQFRHCKESLLSPTVHLQPISGGDFRCRSVRSDDPPGAWEHSLPDHDLDPVDAIDAANWLKKRGITPDSDQGIRVLELVSRGISVDQIEQYDIQRQKRKKVRIRAVA